MKKASLLVCTMVLLLLGACGTSATPTPTPTPPDSGVTPMPTLTTLTRLSPAAQEGLVEFAMDHRQIAEEWDELHLAFDAWVAGNLVCEANSLRATLAKFDGDFAQITDLARALPRGADISTLADTLIEAAEGEEEALRQLLTEWQPDREDLFENVAVQHSAAAAAQSAVADALRSLDENTSAITRARLDGFSKALDTLNASWDQFHEDYGVFRFEQAGLTPPDREAQLSQLVAQFGDLVIEVRELPTLSLTRPVVDILVEATEEEALVLRRLRNTFQQEQSGTSPSELDKPPPPSAVIFADFDDQITLSNTQRRAASEALADLIASASAKSKAAVQAFSEAYSALLSRWTAFHQEYDSWRGTEGGCSRVRALEALGGFSLRLSALAKEVRALPRLPILQPLGEVLVEAAEREDLSLKSLRTSWRPFDATVYAFFEQERNAASKLRRQVDAGVNELLTQHDITPSDSSE